MVSVFVHLKEIIMCIVGQVISMIGITGHHPRIISDDVARHLERGARLVRLSAEEEAEEEAECTYSPEASSSEG